MPSDEPELRRANLLIVTPLSYRHVDGHIYFDRQSRGSLNHQLESFHQIIMAMPVMDEVEAAKPSVMVWDLADDLLDRIQFVPLPRGSTPEFIKHYARTSKTLRRCIDKADRLLFALGGGDGLLHDWGQVAAEEAIKAGRKFALHADWNNFGVWAAHAERSSGVKKMKMRLKAWITKTWQKRLVGRCDLMICNGQDIKMAYSPFCRSPEIAFKIHDFHIGPDKFVSREFVEEKCRQVLNNPVLRIVYAGQAQPRKAPLQWIEAIAEARRLGASLKAIWLGDGPMLEEMRAKVKELGLEDIISMPGFVADRDSLIDAIRAGDVLMFTHLEPESPRILIESLISATPIVGYLRDYPKDLISENEGGLMTPLGDHKALGAAIAEMAGDRQKVVDLIRRAMLDGQRFDSDKMYLSRCDKIKEMIRPATADELREVSQPV